MKPREHGRVVDPKLNVYGVEGLKVAGRSKCILYSYQWMVLNDKLDVSIPPSNITVTLE